ncbi:hypothetical protein Cflav_PD1468 [Pedosphaera parvula Ellin514]|uniref:Uncharacterized protein n=1 Tax=Pedosphaera parvula (strain Ellin514) TaxID=320771 RepID=B9XPU3_PEDPL|nr:hypothetical protein Cflav_PD1468 [Pedosphaera parvula Ellin514]
MPNALGVLVNLPDTVKRDAVDLPLGIGELKGLWAFGRKAHLFQWDQNDAVFSSIVVSQLKVPFGKLRIPPDPIEQFVNGNHWKFMPTAASETAHLPQVHASEGISVRQRPAG